MHLLVTLDNLFFFPFFFTLKIKEKENCEHPVYFTAVLNDCTCITSLKKKKKKVVILIVKSCLAAAYRMKSVMHYGIQFYYTAWLQNYILSTLV